MTCDHATNLISANLDGEILAPEQADLDAHLAACPACRTTADALAAQDSALDRAFAPRRARVDHLISATVQRIHHEQRRPRPLLRLHWLNTLLSAAAGFALALLILQPWESRTAPTLPDASAISRVTPAASADVVAHLALSTGRIDLLPPGKSQWQPMPTGAPILPGSRIRTPRKVRCELAMSDGSEIRLNESTELLVASPRNFDLSGGRIWSTVAAAPTPFNVAVAGATVTALGTQFDVNLEPNRATVIVVEGATQITGKSGRNTILYPGEQVEIVDGSPGQAQRTHNVLVATAWIHEILAMKGRDNTELHHRLNELFAELGQTKVKVLLETEIRSLGDHAIIPLARYLQSDRSRGQGEAERRDMAARILEDIAQPWAIPELITLLSHDDGAVRFHAANALLRLTGQDLGRPAEAWRSAPSDSAAGQWRTWFEQHKSSFPTTGPLNPLPPDDPPSVKARGD